MVAFSGEQLPRRMAIVAWGSLVLALGFGVLAFMTWRASSTLAERGVTTTASVIVSDYAPNGTSSITVGFRDAVGTPREGSVDVASSPPPKGTSVTITYDPEDPSTLRLAGADADQNMGAQGWAGVAVLFGVIALAALGLRRLMKRPPPSRDFGGTRRTTS